MVPRAEAGKESEAFEASEKASGFKSRMRLDTKLNNIAKATKRGFFLLVPRAEAGKESGVLENSGIISSFSTYFLFP